VVFFRRNNTIFGKESKVFKTSSKVGPRPESADRGGKENHPPFFVKKENMRACRPGKGVQSLLGRDDGGEKRPGKGAREKKHAGAFYDKKRHRKNLSGSCRRRIETERGPTSDVP
jgi:hypothetical protein